MGFGPGGGGGSSSIGGSTDVALNNAANNEVLTYDTSIGKWKNASGGGGTAPSMANIPAGSTITVAKSGATWPARPTARNDVIVLWKGTDPSPPIVSSGTGGMLEITLIYDL